nr:MAG TPA: hypothetical protein [Caudoviricetes sp.]
MLNIKEINFPIIFNFPADYTMKHITFENDSDNGTWSNGNKSGLPISYFIKQHNTQNQYNTEGKPYFYKMAAKKEKKREDNDLLDALSYLNIKPGQVFFNGAVFAASIGAKDYDYICKVENMPVGATLLGVQSENGEWDELKFKPSRIEVHDNVICLLSGYSGGYKSGNNYDAEINIKIGTNVKIKNSTNC